ncbi:MAG: hypothetical protein KGI68_13720 [Alphaproteobacteria bacterium]|nr:hypothetical protein [Alphaproteobacteria bacterium]MDE2164251.1 hypothetical protein [Alphaproteobacteria bacterium]MDE2500012.1 hypothetical protein [Alphaproteobacteria bacterium]
MSEASESYDLEILNAAGTAVVRTVSSLTSASAVYAAPQQTADFGGSIPNPLKVRVYQLSAVFGRGNENTDAIRVGRTRIWRGFLLIPLDDPPCDASRQSITLPLTFAIPFFPIEICPILRP